MQVIDSANEVVDSIDREELAKFLSLKSDPEDEEAEVCIILLNNCPPPLSFSFWRLIISNLISINNFFHCCLPYASLTYFKFSGEWKLIISYFNLEKQEEDGDNSWPISRGTVPKRIGTSRYWISKGRSNYFCFKKFCNYITSNIIWELNFEKKYNMCLISYKIL